MKINYLTTLIMAIPLMLSTSAWAGTNLTDVSKVMVIIEMDKAQKVLEDARTSSQKSISKSRLQEILKQAEDVLGATVQCSSSEVTYEAK